MEEEKTWYEKEMESAARTIELWNTIQNEFDNAFKNLSLFEKEIGLDEDELNYLKRQRNKLSVKISRYEK